MHLYKNFTKFILFSMLLMPLSALAQKEGDFRSIGSGGWNNASTATATATVTNGKVTKITVTASSSGYAIAPTITINGAGTGATATAVLTNGRVTAIKVTNGGSGYVAGTTTVGIIGANQPASIWAVYHAATSSPWKIKSADSLGADSINMRVPGYDASAWLSAVVPGTIYNSYVTDSVQTGMKDPDFGTNVQDALGDTRFDDSFWYRTEFTIPPAYAGKKVWLNIKAINKLGQIYLNNVLLGGLKGFRMSGRYEITSGLNKTGKNVLAIKIGTFNKTSINDWEQPTYMAGNGWDYTPQLPGYSRGLTDKIFLNATGAVTIADPYMQTVALASDNSQATLKLEATLQNTSDSVQTGTMAIIMNPGNVVINVPVTLQPKQGMVFTPGTYMLNNPQLWWPNGYGDPNLYHCQLIYSINGNISDSTSFNFGVRKFNYKNDKFGVLNVYCNNRKIFVRGGCWGMSEYMLRVHGKGYEPRIRFHKEMGFNMIRAWCGTETDDEFYDYCDKYGIMLWDEFWENGPYNFLNDQNNYLANVPFKLKRDRNHACVSIWCGVNEGLSFVDTQLEDSVKKYDENERLYQSTSNAGNTADNTQFGLKSQGGISADGPYSDLDLTSYFTKTPSTGYNTLPQSIFTGNYGFHPEWGLPCFVTSESFRQFMPAANLWPENSVWDYNHYFGYTSSSESRGGGAGCGDYVNRINNQFGTAQYLEDFCRKAQLQNIQTHKAMFEGYNDHMWNDASGLLMWMSQPSFTTMIWQTYDFYLDCTGGYWGVKKACEPVHIQWSIASDSVKVINATLKDMNGLTATSTLYDISGNVVPGFSNTATVNATNDTTTFCFKAIGAADLALNKPGYATSSATQFPVQNAFDGNLGTRWAVNDFNSNDWIYVDLGTPQSVSAVSLVWQNSAISYAIQVSNDATNWTNVYTTTAGAGGTENITFPTVTARYVRMLGSQKSNVFGYSLYEFSVYAQPIKLPSVYFIKLKLTDASGNLVSDNFYWASPGNNFTSFSTIPVVNLQQSYTATKLANGNELINLNLTNPANSGGLAFDVHVQLMNPDGSRVLPVFMNDNYFTIPIGETKNVTIEFDPSLVKGGTPHFLIDQYNSRQ